MSWVPTITERDDIAPSLSGAPLWMARLVWVIVCVLTVTVGAAGFSVYFAGDQTLVVSQGPLALQPGFAQELTERLFDVTLLKAGQVTVHVGGWLLFVATAALLFVRRSRDLIVLLSSAMLLALGSALFAPGSLLVGTHARWALPAELLGIFDAGPSFWRSLAGVSVVLFAFVFPDGRFALRWTRPIAVGFLGVVALSWLLPGFVDVESWPVVMRVLWTAGLAVLVAAAQVHRYVAILDDAGRRQTRLVVVALATAIFTLLLIWALGPDLSSSVDFGLVLVTDRLQAIYDLNLLTLLTIALMLLPAAITVSVARHRLWDIDLIVNRALVYGLLTGVIAGLLFLLVAIAGALAGDRFGTGVGVATTSVLMVVIFHPLRRRTQAQVDRRFYRQQYDAERTIDGFRESVRDLSDIGELTDRLTSVLDETLRPATVELVVGRPGTDEEAEIVSAYLVEANGPIPINGDPSVPLIEKRGVDLVVPLVSRDELVGVIELGSRLGGRAYTGLDHSFLRRLAESVAPVLRYAQIVDQQARAQVVRKRMEHELDVARSIQMNLLPRTLPDLEGWEVAACYRPAREVGGDLYDFIPLPEGRWGIVVADVTDKGVPAAMVMATCRSVLRSVATSRDAVGPGSVLERVNELLLPDIPDNMFVTCFYAVIDLATSVFSYANAGHDLPVVWSDEVRRVRARGMPLGVMAGSKYEEGEIVIGGDESLLFYTDGLVEAHNDRGEMFGRPRLEGWLAGRVGGARLIEDLLAKLDVFRPVGAEPEDDLTLVSLRRLTESRG